MNKVSLLDAARQWVREMNAIPTEMIAKCMRLEPDEWSEVTLPALYDRVSTTYGSGEITNIKKKEDKTVYEITVDSNEQFSVVECEIEDFDVRHDDILPMWGYMWAFDNIWDEEWVSNEDGIEKMSEAGFRIYYNDEFGYFFGIDGAGYDFYEAHWVPLYKQRGLKWHTEVS